MARNVVVTGGGTVAPIDDVRQIANASSGRLSAMISESCLALGAEVWHVSTPSALSPFARSARFDLDADDPREECARLDRLRRQWQAVRDRLHPVPLPVGTASEYASRLGGLFRRERIDIAFLAMAVSDYEPEPVAGKLRSDADELVIQCRATPKVIQSVRDWVPDVYLVGFKLLSGVPEAELIQAAEEACATNRADLTVANDLHTVRAGRHTIHLVRPGQPVETFGPGEPIAERLVERAFAWADAKRRGS